MKILLDTHTFLWALQDDPRLPRRCRELMTDRAHHGYLSVVSIWELLLKWRAGKLALRSHPAMFLLTQAAAANLTLVEVQASHLLELERLPQIHSDPFDHLLIAQAKAEGMVLMSGDQAIAKYPVEVVWQ